MEERIREKNHPIKTESGDKNGISERMTEHFAQHQKCNLKIDPELPKMTSRKFDYIKEINLTDYYKPGLTKRNIHCQICKFDINAKKLFLHTISTGHKYNKLFVQIVQNICENRDIDFIVLDINWLQCRYCGIMIINKHPYDLIDTHVHGEAHITEKEYCLNDFILRQYGHSPGQRDLLKTIDILLLSNQMDKNEDMKMKGFEAPQAQLKRTKFLPENSKNSILEPIGFTEGYEARETEELLVYIDRLLMEEFGSCKMCREIDLDYKNNNTSDVSLQNKNTTKKKSQKCSQNTKVQIVKKSPKSQMIVEESSAGAVCLTLLWPPAQAINHQINTNGSEADLPSISSENCDQKHTLERVITGKKKKKTAVKSREANEYKLPRHSSVKRDVNVAESHSKVTEPRMENRYELTGLPQKNTSEDTEPTSILEYKIENSESRQGYKGGKVNWQNGARFQEKTKRKSYADAVRQNLPWPTVQAIKHQIYTDECKAGLPPISPENCDEKHERERVITRKKVKKTAVESTEADEYELPTHSGVKGDVDVESHSKITKPRVENFFKLMGLPQKKTTKCRFQEKIERENYADTVRQESFWPTVHAMKHHINTVRRKADLRSIRSEKRDETDKPGKVVTKKKMKKTVVNLIEANEYKLPSHSSARANIDFVKSRLKVTKPRVGNFVKLAGLPQKKTTKSIRPTSIFEYKIKNLEPRRGYKGGRINWQKEAKLNEQDKIRAARDNFVCQLCCKSVPNSKFYIYNHMKGSKHKNRMLHESSDNIWRSKLSRKYNRAQAIKRMLYEDFLMNCFE